MGRFVTIIAALSLLAAAPLPVADKVPFAATVRGLTFTEKVASLSVLPGEDVSLEVTGPNAPYRIDAGDDASSVYSRTTRALRWRAPAAPGLSTLKIEDARDRTALTLHVFTMVPIDEVRNGRLNGYRIGTYPAKTRPAGFVEVTPENVRTKLSPHFELRQFLCKQPGGFPKYVVLSEALILKLERIVDALEREDRDLDTLTVLSGYRTPFYNESIGNVRDSQHTAGTAADIYVDHTPDGRMDDLDRDGALTRDDAIWLFRLIDGLDRRPEAVFRGGLGDYGSTAAHGPFVHVDVRGRLARWRG
jgi:hypothetical protein